MRKILLMIAASIVSTVCWGQVPDMQPAPELKKFGWMVGEWTASSNWSMMGMDMTADMNVKIDWDGQFLHQKSKYNFDGLVEMTETMMFGYDPDKKEYFSNSYSNMAPLPRTSRGKIVSDALVMTSDPWNVMGESAVSRATLTKQSDNQFTIKLEAQDGDDWIIVTESVFKRKG